jgi:hypothetical protein
LGKLPTDTKIATFYFHIYLSGVRGRDYHNKPSRLSKKGNCRHKAISVYGSGGVLIMPVTEVPYLTPESVLLEESSYSPWPPVSTH